MQNDSEPACAASFQAMWLAANHLIALADNECPLKIGFAKDANTILNGRSERFRNISKLSGRI